jgi:hypothetical protein
MHASIPAFASFLNWQPSVQSHIRLFFAAFDVLIASTIGLAVGAIIGRVFGRPAWTPWLAFAAGYIGAVLLNEYIVFEGFDSSLFTAEFWVWAFLLCLLLGQAAAVQFQRGQRAP